MSWSILKSTAFVQGIDSFKRASLWERMRLNDVANAFKLFPLGGSRSIGIVGTGTIIIPEYEEIELDGTLLAGYTITVRVDVKTDDVATSITPLLYDVTLGAANVTGTASTSTSWASQALAVTLNAAAHKYHMRVTKNNATNDVYCKAYLELKAP